MLQDEGECLRLEQCTPEQYLCLPFDWSDLFMFFCTHVCMFEPACVRHAVFVLSPTSSSLP